eukprot:286000_1
MVMYATIETLLHPVARPDPRPLFLPSYAFASLSQQTLLFLFLLLALLGLDGGQLLVLAGHHTLADVEHDLSISRGLDHVLHLHRLQDQDGLARRDLGTSLDEELAHLTGHGAVDGRATGTATT